MTGIGVGVGEGTGVTVAVTVGERVAVRVSVGNNGGVGVWIEGGLVKLPRDVSPQAKRKEIIMR